MWHCDSSKSCARLEVKNYSGYYGSPPSPFIKAKVLCTESDAGRGSMYKSPHDLNTNQMYKNYVANWNRTQVFWIYSSEDILLRSVLKSAFEEDPLYRAFFYRLFHGGV